VYRHYVCGRFTNKFYWKNLHRLMELTTPPVDLPLRYNVAPTQPAPVVRHQGAEHGGPRALSMLRWGLVPSWAKDLKIGNAHINARAEGIEAKPAFRAAFKRRRCVVPVSGFYEWKKLDDGKSKQPYYITASDEEPLAFAGLWEFWKPPASEGGGVEGEPIESFTIITTTPNEMMARLHDRMPVILDRANFGAWLDPANQDASGLLALLRPYPAELMMCHPVSTLVNSPRNDDAACIERVAVAAPEVPPAPPSKKPPKKPSNEGDGLFV